jgi:3'(2'), 5'-bisphosphate nucleotidase
MHEQALAIAREAAALGAEVIEPFYRRGHIPSESKGPGDPVTEADRAANAAIVSFLRARCPDDAVCAEENSIEDNLRNLARGGRCWFVDPIDGTREFIARNGEFCVMVGLAVDGAPVAGALVAPAVADSAVEASRRAAHTLRREFWGAVGLGAFESIDGRPPRALKAVAPTGAPRMIASRSRPDPRISAVATALGAIGPRPCGSLGLKVALLLAGEADLYILARGGSKLWDACAPHAIAAAAGAVVSDIDGAPVRYSNVSLELDRGIVVGPEALHPRAIAALRSAM